MHRILLAVALILISTGLAVAQDGVANNPPLTITTVDGTTKKTGIIKIVVPNGLLSITGPNATVTFGSGTVTSSSVVTANGVSATVGNPTTTPAFTFTLGNITPTTVNGLTFVSQATGFTIAGGTTSKTFTLNNNIGLSGTDGSTLNVGAGGSLGTAAFTASSAYEVPLTFSGALTRTVNTITLGNLGAASASSLTLSGNLLSTAAGGSSLGSSGAGFAQLFLDFTNTTTGTTGDQTINKAQFQVNFAATATSLVVTNSKIGANSNVICSVMTNDTTLKNVQAVVSSGSVTLFGNAAATAEARVGCNVWSQ